MSIEAKDLRLGNYVNEQYWDSVDGCFKFAKIVVDGIYKKHIVCENNGAYNLDDIQPIPLTENWLVRCGAKKTDKNDEFGGYIIYYPNGNGMRIKNNQWSTQHLSVKLEYVHQLQNLYWCLCGEELKIIL